MPKYEVTYTQKEIYSITVEAESKDEAEQIVSSMIDCGEIDAINHVDSDADIEAYRLK